MDIRVRNLLGEISSALREIPHDAPAAYIPARDVALADALDLIADKGADPEIVLPELMTRLERAARPPLAALPADVDEDALRELLDR